MRIRRFLIRLLVGKKRFVATLSMIDMGLEQSAGCVTDPEMHKNEDDIEFVKHLRRNMVLTEFFWLDKEAQRPNWYEMTKFLEG